MVRKLVPLILISVVGVAIAQAPVGAPSAAGSGAPGSSGMPSGAGIGSDTQYVPPATTKPSPTTTNAADNPVRLASIETRFSQLDTNHNGSLSPEELDLIPGDTISSSAARFKQMDTNHDGKVSAAEYSAAQTALQAGANASNAMGSPAPATP